MNSSNHGSIERIVQQSKRIRLVFLTATVFGVTAASMATEAWAQPVSLDERTAIRLALEHNPSLAVNYSNVRRADYTVLFEESRYSPSLFLRGGYTRTQSPSLNVNGVVTPVQHVYETSVEFQKAFATGTQFSALLSANRQTSTSYMFLGSAQPTVLNLGPSYGVTAKVSVVQPLLRGAGRDVGEAELRAARVNKSLAERTSDRARSELVRDVVSAYWELWYSRQSIEIEKQSLSLAVRQQNEAETKIKLGSIAPAEIFSLATAVATRKESLATAQSDQESKQVDLIKLLGTEHGNVPLSVSDDAPREDYVAPDGFSALAEAQSLEVKEQETSLELALLQMKTAGDSQRPRLDLDGYVQTQGVGDKNVGDALAQFSTFGAVSVHLGLTLELPLDSSKKKNEYAKAQASVESSRLTLQATKQRARSDANKLAAVDSATRTRIDLAQQTIAIAEQQVQAEQARFLSGGTTSLAVVQAQSQLREAQLRLARAKADLAKNTVSIKHLLGELLK